MASIRLLAHTQLESSVEQWTDYGLKEIKTLEGHMEENTLGLTVFPSLISIIFMVYKIWFNIILFLKK